MKTHIIISTVCALVTCATEAQTFTIKTNEPRQRIEHFGASDAWSMQDIGIWPEEDVVRQTADWLFSSDTTATGQPKGIALSTWRFNLGAGSTYQGDAAQINRSTRTECFLMPDGTYDFSRQPGQLRFLRMAKERGVPYLHAFLNSPPVYYTENHLATNTGRGGTLNLRQDCYDSLAIFMATAIEGLERHHGLHIDYISPINEPDGHWNWLGPKQEGSPATNLETARIARSASRVFTERGLDTHIVVNESSDLRCLLGIYHTTWERGNTVATLFSPDSTATCVKGLPLVEPVIAAHSYWTNTPIDTMPIIRQKLRDLCKSLGVDYWQTELCIMQNDEEIGGGGGYDFTMKTALYVARVIHNDLTEGDAHSWSWWRAAGGDYKDGLLRYYERRHKVSDSRLLWALGHYSRFVRPGAVRYNVEGRQDPYGLMVSAYKNTDGTWAVVAINYANESRELTIGANASHPTWRIYRTSDTPGETLSPVGYTNGTTTLPPRSIITLTTTLQ